MLNQTNTNSHKDCFHSILKFQLSQAIRKMAAAPGAFVKDKDRQFTRNRKLPFEKLLYLILFMRGVLFLTFSSNFFLILRTCLLHLPFSSSGENWLHPR